MAVFGTAELADQRATQTAFMQDSCQIGTRSSTQDAVGQLIDTFTYGSVIACGLRMVGGLMRSEFRKPDGTIVNADAELRLPHGTVLTADDKVKVTKRHGVAITALTYDVMGEPLIGPSGIVCYLRAVTT